jgi:hypothetical protein
MRGMATPFYNNALWDRDQAAAPPPPTPPPPLPAVARAPTSAAPAGFGTIAERSDEGLSSGVSGRAFPECFPSSTYVQP